MIHPFIRPRGGTLCAAGDTTQVLLPNRNCFISIVQNELQAAANSAITLFSRDSSDPAYQVLAAFTPGGAQDAAVFTRLNTGDGLYYESSDGSASIWVTVAAGGGGAQLIQFHGVAPAL